MKEEEEVEEEKDEEEEVEMEEEKEEMISTSQANQLLPLLSTCPPLTSLRCKSYLSGGVIVQSILQSTSQSKYWNISTGIHPFFPT